MSSPHYNKYNRDGGDAETHAEELNERRCFPTRFSLDPKIADCNSFFKKNAFYAIFLRIHDPMQGSVLSMILDDEYDSAVR